MKLTRSLPLFIPLLAVVFLLTSCGGKTYELTGKIVGKWKVAKFKADEVGEYVPEKTITFEFREDESVTVVNEDAALEATEPDNPLRAIGTVNGFYKVDAPKGFTMREKFLGPMFYSGVEATDDKLEIAYTSGKDQRVTIFMDKMK